MNRILQLDEVATKANQSQAGRPEQDKHGRTERPQWHFLWPMHFEAGYAYPLLIWLHGGGADQRQLLPVMNLMETRNFISIAPCGTLMPESGRRDVCFWDQSEAGVDEAAERVRECIRETVRRAHVNTDRIYLAGYADGGTMALRLAFQDPDQFAGVATIQGAFPTNNRPLQAFPKTAKLRVLVVYGREATRYNSQLVAHDMRLMHAAGARMDVRQYETDDSPVDVMFHDLSNWIMNAAPPANPLQNIRFAMN